MPIFNKRWGCRLKELRGKKFLPPVKTKGEAGLNALAASLNAMAGVVAPKEVLPAPVAIKETPIVQREPTPERPVSSPTAGAVTPLKLNRVFVTGRLKSGKDYCLAQASFKIYAFADPLYWLAEYFFGKQEKDVTRTFLQQAGQIGRGTISAEYPLTIERALFVKTVRAIRDSSFAVDWSSYGSNENIWLDSLVVRVAAEPATARIAVSGVRFQNEFRRLTAEGFVHRHILCSAATWTDRLKKVGLAPDSPACRDMSERLASALDADVTRQLSQQKSGAKLAAIWCDEKVLAPSNRLLTLAEFVAQFSK